MGRMNRTALRKVRAFQKAAGKLADRIEDVVKWAEHRYAEELKAEREAKAENENERKTI